MPESPGPEVAFVYETTIATTPHRLWQALTSGEVTRAYWFDRRVESEWTVGAPVRFYVGDTDEVSDTGTVLEVEPQRRLAYSFAPTGVPLTRVTFDLEPSGDGVRMRLVHDELADPADAAGWGEGWAPILRNLQAFLEGQEPDPTEPPSLTKHIAAPPAEVFRALTDPELVGRWWVPSGATTVVQHLDARAGGSFAIDVTLAGGHVVGLRGDYREVTPPSRIVHTLRAEGDSAVTVVTWRLTPSGGGTLLELTEAGAEMEEAWKDGWLEGIDKLADLLAPARKS